VAAETGLTSLTLGELWGRESRESKANPTERIQAAIPVIDKIE